MVLILIKMSALSFVVMFLMTRPHSIYIYEKRNGGGGVGGGVLLHSFFKLISLFKVSHSYLFIIFDILYAYSLAFLKLLVSLIFPNLFLSTNSLCLEANRAVTLQKRLRITKWPFYFEIEKFLSPQ